MVAHNKANTTAYHCSDFEFLYFEGPPATSPVASHNTAVFKGAFSNNRDDSTLTAWIKIVDNGEGKSPPAKDQIGDVPSKPDRVIGEYGLIKDRLVFISQMVRQIVHKRKTTHKVYLYSRRKEYPCTTAEVFCRYTRAEPVAFYRSSKA